MRKTLMVVMALALIGLVVWAACNEGARSAARVRPERDALGAPRGVPAPLRTEGGAEPSEARSEVASRPPMPSTPTPRYTGKALLGRLVWSDRSPVAGAKCDGWVRLAARHWHVHTETDRDGRFRLELPGDLVTAPGRHLWLVNKVADDRPWSTAEHAMAPDYPDALTEIGDIVVAEQPLLVAGVVVGPTGGSVAGTRVHALPDKLDVEDYANPFWSEVMRGETDAAGRFRIHGKGRACPYRIVARRPGAYQDEIPRVQPGTRGVILTLSAGGTVRGSVLLAEGFEPGQLLVRGSGEPVLGHLGLGPILLALDRPRGKSDPLDARLDAQGRFDLSGLRPGRLRVALHLSGHGEPLAVVRGVEVEAGRVTEDPRLQQIDLRQLRTLHLRLRDADGAALRPMYVGVRQAGEKTWKEVYVQGDGKLELTVVGAAADLRVAQAGYRAQVFDQVSRDGELQVRAGIPFQVRVALDDLAGLTGCRHLLRFERDASPKEDGLEPQSERHTVMGDAPLQFHAPSAGRYRVVLHLTTANAIGGMVVPLALDTETVVSVFEGIQEQFVVRPKAGESRRAHGILQALSRAGR